MADELRNLRRGSASLRERRHARPIQSTERNSPPQRARSPWVDPQARAGRSERARARRHRGRPVRRAPAACLGGPRRPRGVHVRLRLRLEGRRLGVGRVPALRRVPGLVVPYRRRGILHRAMTRRLLGALLIALMAVGSVVLWIGIPVGWLYLASQLVDSSQPAMGPYVLVIVGIPATMVVIGKLLATLDRVYARVVGAAPQARTPLPWHR